jgi:hypothetical protein
MRTVLLVRDGASFWDEVGSRLAKANARVVACTAEELAVAADEVGPDLVVLGEQVHRGPGAALRQPRIVVREQLQPTVQVVDGSRPPLALAGWPLPEGTFLELTARMLRVSERRIFRALIRILRPRVQESVMGTSLDFSITGMALRSGTALELGEPVVISLHLPGGKGSLRLLSEVTRVASDPTDASTFYGARFLNLDQPTRQSLREFVWDSQ